MAIKVGDLVRRIPSERLTSGFVPALNGSCVLVEEVRDGYLGFSERDGGYGWVPDFYDLVDAGHTDADTWDGINRVSDRVTNNMRQDGTLRPVFGPYQHTADDIAMALELAELMPTLGGDCGQSDCASCVAHWLRAQVVAALRGE